MHMYTHILFSKTGVIRYIHSCNLIFISYTVNTLPCHWIFIYMMIFNGHIICMETNYWAWALLLLQFSVFSLCWVPQQLILKLQDKGGSVTANKGSIRPPTLQFSPTGKPIISSLKLHSLIYGEQAITHSSLPVFFIRIPSLSNEMMSMEALCKVLNDTGLEV